MAYPYLIDDEDEQARREMDAWLSGGATGSPEIATETNIGSPTGTTQVPVPTYPDPTRPPETVVPVGVPPVPENPTRPPETVVPVGSPPPYENPTPEETVVQISLPPYENPTQPPPTSTPPAPIPPPPPTPQPVPDVQVTRTPTNMPPPPPPPTPPPPAPNFADAVQMPELGPLPTFNAPAAPGQSPLMGDIEEYARQWMGQSNPYLSDLVSKSREEMDLRLAEQAADEEREMLEWLSSRNLVGSSVEGDLRVRQGEALRRQRASEEVALLDRLARGETEGRMAAGGFALDAAAMAQQAEQFRAQFEMEAAQTGFDTAFRSAQLRQSDSLARAELNLQAATAGDQASMDRVRLELDQMRAMDAALLDRAQLAQRDSELDLRAQEIEIQAMLEGRRISAEDARWQAEIAFRREQEANRQDEFNRSLHEQERQHDDLMDWRFGDAGALDEWLSIVDNPATGETPTGETPTGETPTGETPTGDDSLSAQPWYEGMSEDEIFQTLRAQGMGVVEALREARQVKRSIGEMT